MNSMNDYSYANITTSLIIITSRDSNCEFEHSDKSNKKNRTVTRR